MPAVTLGVGAPFPKQSQFLSIDRCRRGSSGGLAITRTNYVGGRGCAKTRSGILLLLRTVSDMPGLRGFWAEPRWSDVERVFLTALREIVPAKLWTLRERNGHRYIQWVNGHETDLLARQVDNPNKRVALGSNYAYGIQDEAADGFDQRKFLDMQNAIRLPTAPYLFHDTLSTPVVGGYEAWCRQENSTTIHSSSFDNPYLSADVIESWIASMPEDLVKQEVLGQFVTMSGLIWKGFKESPWPGGNIMEGYAYDPQQPYILGMDLGGAQSAFQAVQYIDPIVGGKRMFAGRLAIVVAEWTPNNMMLSAVLDHVTQTMGKAPAEVIVGADIASPGHVGVPGADLLVQRGWRWKTPTDSLARKDIQRNAASALILNNAGERRMAVAATKGGDGIYRCKQHFGEGKNRGILEMFRRDTYPPATVKDIFWKDKPKRGQDAIEDDRDAFLYWATVMHPPAWGVGARYGVESAA